MYSVLRCRKCLIFCENIRRRTPQMNSKIWMKMTLNLGPLTLDRATDYFQENFEFSVFTFSFHYFIIFLHCETLSYNKVNSAAICYKISKLFYDYFPSISRKLCNRKEYPDYSFWKTVSEIIQFCFIARTSES